MIVCVVFNSFITDPNKKSCWLNRESLGLLCGVFVKKGQALLVFFCTQKTSCNSSNHVSSLMVRLFFPTSRDGRHQRSGCAPQLGQHQRRAYWLGDDHCPFVRVEQIVAERPGRKFVGEVVLVVAKIECRVGGHIEYGCPVGKRESQLFQGGNAVENRTRLFDDDLRTNRPFVGGVRLFNVDKHATDQPVKLGGKAFQVGQRFPQRRSAARRSNKQRGHVAHQSVRCRDACAPSVVHWAEVHHLLNMCVGSNIP